VLLGLGANLGEAPRTLALALERLGAFVHLEVISSLYRTAPVGYAAQPDFYNLVAAGTTALEAGTLLEALLEIERALGRERLFLNAPRTIDLDLLAYGDHVIDTPALTLPHPRLHERGFVLVPLAEIAPAWRHPRLGRTAAELLEAAGPFERVERLGPLARYRVAG
jgi:2-amino-4-hydroxy-6-hydroxymethyldihydropteridine diphosphokinase